MSNVQRIKIMKIRFRITDATDDDMMNMKMDLKELMFTCISSRTQQQWICDRKPSHCLLKVDLRVVFVNLFPSAVLFLIRQSNKASLSACLFIRHLLLHDRRVALCNSLRNSSK